jgi:hypothetical protein
MKAKEQKSASGKALPLSRCPVCGYAMDAATCAFEKKPKPKTGDFGVCMKCGEILVFSQTMTLREAKLDDFMSCGPTLFQQLDRVQQLIRKERVVP